MTYGDDERAGVAIEVAGNNAGGAAAGAKWITGHRSIADLFGAFPALAGTSDDLDREIEAAISDAMAAKHGAAPR